MLTVQRFHSDPIGDERIAASAQRLHHAGVLLLEQTIVGPAHHPATHRKLDLIVWLALNQYLLLAAYAYWPAGKLGALLGGKGGLEGGAATSGVLKPKMMV